MAEIERAALEVEVVARLSRLLRETRGDPYGTTGALSHFTTILAWVAHRVHRPDEENGRLLKQRWQALTAGDEPWCLPNPLAVSTLYDAVISLRDAAAHAGVRSVEPVNEKECLVGFQLGTRPNPTVLSEDELRRFGEAISCDFVEHMRKK